MSVSSLSEISGCFSYIGSESGTQNEMQQTISSNGSGELRLRRPHLASYPASPHAGIKTRPQNPVPDGIELRNAILSSRNSLRAD
tara:strand:+ start:129 stop:383 length:255 start_codon:yes stop_codon:yes gene_type:complete